MRRPARATSKTSRASGLEATIIALPVIFEENKGQAPKAVRFMARARNHTTFFLDDEVVFSLKASYVRMRFVDAKTTAVKVEKALKASGTSFFGKRSQSIVLADSIIYPRIYSGVDWRCYNADGRMRYDFVLDAGVDVKTIRLRFDNALGVTTDGRGNLAVLTVAGTAWHSAPRCYAEAKGRRRSIKGEFVLHGRNEVGFRVSGAKSAEKIIIDPELAYGTFIGGSDVETPSGPNSFISAHDTHVDVAFLTWSTDFPLGTPPQLPADPATGPSNAWFLGRFDCTNPETPQLVFGFSGRGTIRDIASASDGSVYVLGNTSLPHGQAAPEYPVPADALDASDVGTQTSTFVARVEGNGTCQHATFFALYASSVAVDLTGVDSGVYLAGDTEYGDTGVAYLQNPVRASRGGIDGFVAKLDPQLRELRYFTFLGGSQLDRVKAVAADAGKASVLGETRSADYLATPGAYESPSAGVPAELLRQRVFVTQLGSSGQIVFTCLIGDRSAWSNAHEIVSYPDGTIAFSGRFNLPVEEEGTDAITQPAVLKLAAAGNALVFRTPQDPYPYPWSWTTWHHNSLAADTSGGVWVCGWTTRSGLATPGAIQPVLRGASDGTVQKFSAAGIRTYFTYLGGENNDDLTNIATAGDLIFALGTTNSSDFPEITEASAIQPTYAGNWDAILVIIRTVPVDVEVTKSCSPETIQENGHVTYTISVENTGDDTLSGLAIVDSPNAGLVLLSSQPWQVNGSANQATVSNQTLAPGETRTYTIEAVGIEAGTYSNQVQVIKDGTVIGTGVCACPTVIPVPEPPELHVTIQDDVATTGVEGQPVHFTVTIENIGAGPAIDVRLTHEVLAGPSGFMRFDGIQSNDGFTSPLPPAGSYDCTFPHIDPGHAHAVRTFVTTNPLKSGEYKTQATVTIDAFPDDVWDDTSTTRIGTVVDANLVLSIGSIPASDLPTTGVNGFFVELSRTPPNAQPALPGLQLTAEIHVEPGTALPLDSQFLSGTYDPGQPPHLDSHDDYALQGSRWLFMVSAYSAAGQQQTSLRKVPSDSAAYDLWIAAFNLSHPLLPDRARIFLPAAVHPQSIKAHVAGPIAPAVVPVVWIAP